MHSLDQHKCGQFNTLFEIENEAIKLGSVRDEIAVLHLLAYLKEEHEYLDGVEDVLDLLRAHFSSKALKLLVALPSLQEAERVLVHILVVRKNSFNSWLFLILLRRCRLCS